MYGHGGRISDPPPAQAQLRALANAGGYVDDNIRQEEMAHKKVDGKSVFMNDIFAERPIGKPYMYVQRDGVRTLKEKLE